MVMSPGWDIKERVIRDLEAGGMLLGLGEVDDLPPWPLSVLGGDTAGRDVGVFTEESHPQCLPDIASAEEASGLPPGSRGESGGRGTPQCIHSFIHSFIQTSVQLPSPGCQ